MGRRKKKKNSFKSLINLIIFLFLLFFILFLVQKFILPLWQQRLVIEKIPDKIEKEEEPISEIGELEVTLYFSDDDAQYLIPEIRKINQTDDPAKQSLIELIKGPDDSSLYPTVPPTTRVNALYISDGIAYVDLSSEVIKDHPGGSTGELLTVYSIVMTLTSFPDINKVQILVDGNSGETLIGHLDISIPLEREDNWLRR